MPDIAQVVVRSVFMYLVLLALTRMLNKRQISQLSFFDYVVGITIGSMVSTAAVELENRALAAGAGAVTWAVLTVLVGYGVTKSVTFRKLVAGEPIPVIRDGRLLETNLANERLSVDDVLMLLRQQKVFNLADVETALLEPSGKISVLLKGERQPATPQHLGLPLAQQEMPAVVIEDGQVLHDTLRSIGRDRAWLEEQLSRQGIESVRDVMLAQVDGQGTFFVDLYDDARVEPQRPQTAKILGAKLLRFETQMETLAERATDARARRLYTGLAREAHEVREALGGYVQ